jgi:hypothetical protein
MKNKTRMLFLLCALTAAAWSLPGLAQAKTSKPAKSAKPAVFAQAASFDGGAAAFDG